MDNRYSIVFKDLSRCCVCGATYRIQKHEIFFGTANRKKSIEDHMIAPLCPKHHEMSPVAVHGKNRELDLKLKQKAQKVWEDTYGKENPRQEFMDRYGKSWL